MRKSFVVRYEMRPDTADENQRLIENVFAELAETHPDGISYAAFRLDDGVTFVTSARPPTTATRWRGPRPSRNSSAGSRTGRPVRRSPAAPSCSARTGSPARPAAVVARCPPVRAGRRPPPKESRHRLAPVPGL